jgi:phage terminase large subunit
MTIHKGYLSEAAFMDHLDYIVHDVLLPQTMTTGGNLILISTPPDSPGHESYYIMTDCKSNDACITRTIDDVTRLSDELKEQYIDELGGRDSTACRRELYCEWVTDTESAVLPEFNEECAKAVVREFPLPPYYYAWTAMDPGTADKTGILCGHYDFEKHLFCVDNERLLNKETTVGINEQLLIMEKDIYGEHDVYQRFSDTSMQLIYDLNRLHGLSIQPTAKDDLHANVNNVRVLLQQRRIVIHPRCVNLVRQMRQVIWDKSRKTWIRTTAEGHYDLIAALVYLIRNMNPNMNPFPKRKEFANANQHVNDFADDDRVGDTANTLRHAFRIK